MTTHFTRTRPATRNAMAGLLAIGAVAVSLLSASPALADEAAPTQSCWTNADTGEVGCFDASLDPIEQIEAATGTTVVAVPTGSEQGARSAIPASTLGTDTSFLLVTGWDTTGRTGTASMSYFTTNTNICNNGTSYGFGNLGTWSDRFESVQGFNGCDVDLFADILFDGDFIGPITFSDDLGTFKNKASSLIAL